MTKWMKLNKKFMVHITYTKTSIVNTNYLKLMKKRFSPWHRLSVLTPKYVKGFEIASSKIESSTPMQTRYLLQKTFCYSIYLWQFKSKNSMVSKKYYSFTFTLTVMTMSKKKKTWTYNSSTSLAATVDLSFPLKSLLFSFILNNARIAQQIT